MLKRNPFIALFLTSLFLLFSAALAANPINHALIPVDGKTQTIRRQGIQQGLKNVLIKLSGNPQINSVPEIQNLLNHDEDFLKSYRYITKPSPNQPQLYLDLTFDQQALYQQLTAANQAIWPARRPLTLIWINTDSNQSANIIAASDNSDIEQAIETTASSRGIPVVMPIMDLQDQSQMNPENNTLSSKAIQFLLTRYHANAILIGHLTSAGGQWQGQWKFNFHDQPSSWMNTNQTASSVVIDGINQLATMYANEFSVYKNKNLENQFSVRINNVNDLAQYTRAIHAIEQNPAIDNVTVNNMEDSSIDITVTTATDLDNLSHTLTQNEHIIATTNSEKNVDLTLRWSADPDLTTLNDKQQA